MHTNPAAELHVVTGDAHISEPVNANRVADMNTDILHVDLRCFRPIQPNVVPAVRPSASTAGASSPLLQFERSPKVKAYSLAKLYKVDIIVSQASV
jgi:hypothetical protein